MGFRINYDSVIRRANKMDSLSDDLDVQIEKLRGVADSIPSNWEGSASSKFQTQLSLLIKDIRSTKNSMGSVAQTIRDVAIRMKEEDERQAELARHLGNVYIR